VGLLLRGGRGKMERKGGGEGREGEGREEKEGRESEGKGEGSKSSPTSSILL